MSSANIALTIVSPTKVDFPAEIIVDIIKGPNYKVLEMSKKGISSYWMVIFDRKTLKAVENFMFSDESTVPSQINKYVNDSNYFYVLTTRTMSSREVPVGDFYNWLISEGAGTGLKTIEQCFHALNCSGYELFSYTLVNVFGTKVGTSLEFFNFDDNRMITALELKPIEVDGSNLYMPIEL